MQDDERCCGTGTCLINAEGVCWCGQQWNGQEMCRPQAADQERQKAPAPPTSQAGDA